MLNRTPPRGLRLIRRCSGSPARGEPENRDAPDRLNRRDIVSDVTLPDHLAAPSELLQFQVILAVTRDVRGQLLPPEINVGSWKLGAATSLVAVLEATVDEKGGLPFWKDEVRTSWQILSMQAKAKPEPVAALRTNSSGTVSFPRTALMLAERRDLEILSMRLTVGITKAERNGRHRASNEALAATAKSR